MSFRLRGKWYFCSAQIVQIVLTGGRGSGVKPVIISKERTVMILRFLDKYAWGNSAAQDQTASFRLHRLDSLLYGRAT